MTGEIFSMERFSIHDGPGVRTSIFSKAVLCTVSGAIIRKAMRGAPYCSIWKKSAWAAPAVYQPVRPGYTAS